MSNRNYTPYSKMSGEEAMLTVEPEVVVENESASIEEPLEGQTTIPEVEPEIVAEFETMTKPEIIAEPEPTIEPEIRKIGKVNGCKKLNVRNLPNQDAKILTELVEGSEVMIDEAGSTATYYKVCTEYGIDGYCVKKFIKVLP